VRICLIGAGTRGDAQPMVLLARELQRRGHDVVVGVSADLVSFAERAGLVVLPFGPDSQEVFATPEGQRMLAAGNVRQFLTRLAAVAHERFAVSVQELTALITGADLVVAGMLAEDAGLCFTEALGIPLVSLHLTPLRPTRSYASPLVTTRALPGRLNLATGTLFEQVWRRNLAGDMALLRNQLGLAPERRTAPARLAAAGATEVQAYSDVVVPGLSDLGPRRPRVGYLTPTRQDRELFGEGRTEPALDAWLNAGDPPVYLGFGSMPLVDPGATMAMVGRVTGRLGVRALVSAGPSRMGSGADPGPDVHVVRSVDHDEVLPRCRAVVHHGGAGTTAATLLAGRPALVCSVFADQPFWGSRVARLGAGAHVRLASLDEGRLERGLAAVLSPEVGRRAGELGIRLRAEAGAPARAADLVEAAGVRRTDRVR
jgi:sterol 3beta-glucosyltransferase